MERALKRIGRLRKIPLYHACVRTMEHDERFKEDRGDCEEEVSVVYLFKA